MKPPKCEECGGELDRIYIREDEAASYRWTGKEYVHDSVGSAHMECPHCGYDLTSQFEFSVPDDFDPEKYEDPFRDENGIRRCCRYCGFFDEGKYGEYDDWKEESTEGFCLVDGQPENVFHQDKERSPNICNRWHLNQEIKDHIEELSVDPETGEILGC